MDYNADDVDECDSKQEKDASYEDKGAPDKHKGVRL